jgi:hypothetical protein
VFNTIFKNISVTIFVAEIGVPREIVVEFTTTCAIVAYHHLSCEFDPHSWRGVLDKTFCDQVCQWMEFVSHVKFRQLQTQR